ncbi:MAG: pentapeptide repeat-containing protein [Anaerolineales bacterium]
MTDRTFRHYRVGLRRLIKLLGKDHPRLGEALVLQHRLLENLADAEARGSTAELEMSRARILESCNRLCHALLDESFYTLCGLPASARQKAGVGSAESAARPALDAYYDVMNALLQDESLRAPIAATEARQRARAETLQILQTLDGIQKGHVVQFLYEAGLITEGPGVLFLSEADLSDAHLQGTFLIEAHLAGTDLRHAHLDAAHLEWSRLGEARMVGTSLKHAFLVAAHLARAQLQEARLDHARLLGANLAGANLTGARMDHAQMQWASFVTTNFQGASLVDAQLMGAELTSSNLADADFSGANLKGVHLRGARLRGVKYDARTRWPVGFDPIAAKAIKIDA